AICVKKIAHSRRRLRGHRSILSLRFRPMSGARVFAQRPQASHLFALPPAPTLLSRRGFQSNQAKLRIGAVDDPLEREAERAADRVMAEQSVDVDGIALQDSLQRSVQRACGKCEARKEADEKDGIVRAKALDGSRAASPETGGFMEP